MGKTKTRVGVVLRENLGVGKKSTQRSSDLDAQIGRYQVWSKKLRSLIQALEQQNAALLHLDKTRAAVTQQVAIMTQSTPLWDASGISPSTDRPVTTICSYSSVHGQLSQKTKSFANKYKQFVIDYALEWEKVVRTRVEAGIKKAEELRRDLDHYQKKVEDLRSAATKALAKGKQVKADAADKLKRNEEKLLSSKEIYNKVATDLCLLIEEITERSWRDIHPLLIKIAQFDMTLSGDEAKVLGGLTMVVSKLKAVGTAQGISPQPRLKDLEQLRPDLLSTRTSTLAIESGYSPTSLGGSSGLSGEPADMAAPPGSIAPQGRGGFPVQIDSTRRNSFTSVQSEQAPSALAMIAISNAAAPAPTLEDVYAANDSQSLAGAVSLPPLSHSQPLVVSTRFQSDDMSTFSFRSAASMPVVAAPAAMPPPPPSMPPPPPPSVPPPPPPPFSLPPTVDYSTVPLAAAVVVPSTPNGSTADAIYGDPNQFYPSYGGPGKSLTPNPANSSPPSNPSNPFN